MADDLFFRTIPELNQMLVKRQISARELAAAFCDRLEGLGPKYNALAVSTRRTALEMAKEVDGDLKRERLRGPLQGIPFGAKDLLAYPGYPTTWGAKPLATQTFDFKATCIERLEGRGALLAGKLAMVQLAGGGGYERAGASLFGPGLNPWDLSRWSGGSSSGSGSAVAAGLTPFAIGSETWGSILTPAAFCGVTGLRPTYGYVSRYGAMALSWTMDKIGPLCRSAEDCGLVLQVMAGGDTKDRASAGKSFYYGPEYVQEVRKLKVGYHPVDFQEWADPETRPAFQEALDLLRRLGVQMEEVEFPEMPYSSTAGMIIDAEGASIFEPLITSGQIDQLADAGQIAGMRAAQDLKSTDYLRAMRIRTRIQDAVTPLWRNFDILLGPSRTRTANPVDQPLRTPAAPRERPAKRGLSDLGAIGNLLGWPALSLPCGFAGGLPVGIQLVSRPFNENRILALGVAFQRESDWHRRRPPAV
ncbi:MAG: amidase [Bryobacterales bacterium]|jgi:aspartyl-tRNA(Asn)/glutamyl-tRNA(Gln) amidotransferase subunit A|nr:amidase [Bryobacterales bacterium]